MKPLLCPHCWKPVIPDVHNAWHQRYCSRKACQRARNRESCRKWRQQNPGYFKKDTDRVRTWRSLHPHYWRRERRKACSADILMPVHSAGRNTMGMRIRNLEGFTLRHVVIAGNRDWLGLWHDVGLTLQNVVAGARLWAYRGRHGSKDCHAVNAGSGS